MKTVKVAAAVVVVAVAALFGLVSLFSQGQGDVYAAASIARAAQAGDTAQKCTTGPVVTVGGAALDRNAQTVIREGKTAGVGQPGTEIALAVILVESEGKNLASRRVPESIRYANDGVAPGDHLSINLFQQQKGMGWFDTVAHGMSPEYAAASFYRHLKAVRGWERMPPGVVAQRVQGSAYPDRYATRRTEAQALYAKWSGTAPAPVKCEPVIVPVANPVVSGSWANPLAPAAYRVGSVFGPRGNIGWGAGMHKGQDLMVKLGTPVRSVCTGTVTDTAWDPWGGGWMVTTNCGGGITTYSMHNTSFVAKKGQAVTAGTVVALSGSTGHSTGPHVHIQIMVNGKPTDPVPFLAARGVRF